MAPDALGIINRFASAFVQSNQAKIVVGKDPSVTYIFRKDQLGAESTYFERALTNGMLETSTGTIELEDCDEDVMKLFVYWTEQQKLSDLLIQVGAGEDNLNDQLMLDLFIRTWIFADRYLIEKFKSVLLEAVLLVIRRWDHGACLGATLIRRTFAKTSSDCLMRVILVREAINTFSRLAPMELDFAALTNIEDFATLYMQEYRAGAAACEEHPSRWSTKLKWFQPLTYGCKTTSSDKDAPAPANLAAEVWHGEVTTIPDTSRGPAARKRRKRAALSD